MIHWCGVEPYNKIGGVYALNAVDVISIINENRDSLKKQVEDHHNIMLSRLVGKNVPLPIPPQEPYSAKFSNGAQSKSRLDMASVQGCCTTESLGADTIVAPQKALMPRVQSASTQTDTMASIEPAGADVPFQATDALQPQEQPYASNGEEREEKNRQVVPMSPSGKAKKPGEAKGLFQEAQEERQAQEDELREKAERNILQTIVLSAAFDVIMCIVIVVNMGLMAAQLQIRGHHYGFLLGIRDTGPRDGNDNERAFELAEQVFNSVYVVEMTLRLVVLRWEFFHHGSNIVDGVIIIVTSIESLVLKPLEAHGKLVNLGSLRILRAFRILRVQKIMHYGQHMSEIHLLIDTLILSLRGLVWSVVLIFAIIVAGASLMAQLSLTTFEDESIPLEKRQWLYVNFGTTMRACYTMFEMTFTGRWGMYVREIIENISVGFALFLIPYVVCINFAVMRVVSALFLKETLAVAARDDEKHKAAMEKEKERIALELDEFFEEADSSGNGAVSQVEFEIMLQNPNVVEHFSDLGLDREEAEALFGVLCADDGEADYQEFLDATVKMRRNAQVIDIWMMLHRQIKSHSKLHTMHESLDFLHRHLGSDHSSAGLERGISPEAE